MDTQTEAGKAFLDMLRVFAEFETNLRREHQLEGIAATKVRRPLNRPRREDWIGLLRWVQSNPLLAQSRLPALKCRPVRGGTP